ncbi:hypothetical protein [Coprobacter secundus]|uniref:hypothetical protein n=1 Tax=Coprobacter secundus TaxID=1501392 RepID=UPI0022E16442|nr:hypothetical protein [Coprobacter secundus]
MKYKFLFYVLLFIGEIMYFKTNAQEPDRKPLSKFIPPEIIAKKKTDEMKETLQLSDKQYKKMYKLFLKEEQKKLNQRDNKPPIPSNRGFENRNNNNMMPPSKIRPNFPPPPPPINDNFRNAQKERSKREKKIKKILTTEQYEKWKSEEIKKCKRNNKKRRSDFSSELPFIK